MLRKPPPPINYCTKQKLQTSSDLSKSRSPILLHHYLTPISKIDASKPSIHNTLSVIGTAPASVITHEPMCFELHFPPVMMIH